MLTHTDREDFWHDHLASFASPDDPTFVGIAPGVGVEVVTKRPRWEISLTALFLCAVFFIDAAFVSFAVAYTFVGLA
ncbi:MAG: hypothetical protein ABIO70_15090 [Pseudomonadota bacterium]